MSSIVRIKFLYCKAQAKLKCSLWEHIRFLFPTPQAYSTNWSLLLLCTNFKTTIKQELFEPFTLYFWLSCIKCDYYIFDLTLQLSPALRNRLTEIWCEGVTERADWLSVIEHNVRAGLSLGNQQDATSGIGNAMLQFIDWFRNTEIGKRYFEQIKKF